MDHEMIRRVFDLIMLEPREAFGDLGGFRLRLLLDVWGEKIKPIFA
jgi:hypothetical protein